MRLIKGGVDPELLKLSFGELISAKKRTLNAIDQICEAFEIKHQELVGDFEYLNTEEDNFVDVIIASLKLLINYCTAQIHKLGHSDKKSVLLQVLRANVKNIEIRIADLALVKNNSQVRLIEKLIPLRSLLKSLEKQLLNEVKISKSVPFSSRKAA